MFGGGYVSYTYELYVGCVVLAKSKRIRAEENSNKNKQKEIFETEKE